MSLGLILLIIVVLFLVGGFGDRFGAPWQYGYGYGNRGIGIVGVILIIILILILTHNLQV